MSYNGRYILWHQVELQIEMNHANSPTAAIYSQNGYFRHGRVGLLIVLAIVHLGAITRDLSRGGRRLVRKRLRSKLLRRVPDVSQCLVWYIRECTLLCGKGLRRRVSCRLSTIRLLLESRVARLLGISKASWLTR